MSLLLEVLPGSHRFYVYIFTLLRYIAGETKNLQNLHIRIFMRKIGQNCVKIGQKSVKNYSKMGLQDEGMRVVAIGCTGSACSHLGKAFLRGLTDFCQSRFLLVLILMESIVAIFRGTDFFLSYYCGTTKIVRTGTKIGQKYTKIGTSHTKIGQKSVKASFINRPPG